MAVITLTVNGRSYSIDADPDMPLLYALMERQKMTNSGVFFFSGYNKAYFRRHRRYTCDRVWPPKADYRVAL